MKGIRKITPYVPGEQPDNPKIIKLNTNENPYPPTPLAEQQLKNFDIRQLKRYNSVDNSQLKAALAEKFGLTPENFVIGNGSDEVLAFCFLAFFNSKDPILFPDITYGFYKVWAELFNVPFKEIPLNDRFEIDIKDYQQENGGILLTNPNAPTGIFKSLSEIEALLAVNQEVMVIIDEAYIDFAASSAVTLLDKYPNMVIVRTFSKSSSLAGLRVGYAIGQPEYIQIIESIKSSFNPYSVDSLAEDLATAAVKDAAYYEEINTTICQTREWFTEKIAELGFQTCPSQTNFVLTTHPQHAIEDLFYFLERHEVYVRYFPKVERLKNYLRISIGTPKEMEIVYQLLKEYTEQ
ncbi:histidinol-phosphate transaminase [Enterococcus sp. UD-01]|jgi:histidinol-phosphate aminotransferase|uniref:histidinol-phosphate transaminase n=1 Tax=Enterococcus sp. UD-01 TaxID=3373911 RepID=UPI003836A1DD